MERQSRIWTTVGVFHSSLSAINRLTRSIVKTKLEDSLRQTYSQWQSQIHHYQKSFSLFSFFHLTQTPRTTPSIFDSEPAFSELCPLATQHSSFPSQFRSNSAGVFSSFSNHHFHESHKNTRTENLIVLETVFLVTLHRRTAHRFRKTFPGTNRAARSPQKFELLLPTLR